MAISPVPRNKPEPGSREWPAVVREIKRELSLPLHEKLAAVPKNLEERRKLEASIDLDGFFNYLSKIYRSEELLAFVEKTLEILKREDNNPVFDEQLPPVANMSIEHAKFERMKQIVTRLAKPYALEAQMSDLLTYLNDAISYKHVNMRQKLPIALELVLFLIKANAHKKFEAELELEKAHKSVNTQNLRERQFEAVFAYLDRLIRSHLNSSISVRECEKVWFDFLNSAGSSIVVMKYDSESGNFTITPDVDLLLKCSVSAHELEERLVSEYYKFRQSRNGVLPRFIAQNLAEWSLMAEVELMQQRKRGVKVDDKDLDTVRFAHEESEKYLEQLRILDENPKTSQISYAFKSDYTTVIHGISGHNAFNGIFRICEKYELPEFREDDTQIPRNEIRRLRQYLLGELINAIIDRNSKLSEPEQHSKVGERVKEDLQYVSNLSEGFENGIMRWTGTISTQGYTKYVNYINILANKYHAQKFIPAEHYYQVPPVHILPIIQAHVHPEGGAQAA